MKEIHPVTRAKQLFTKSKGRGLSAQVENELLLSFQTKIAELVALDYCFYASSSNSAEKRPSKCCCMQHLRGKEDVIRRLANFMLFYASYKSRERKEWWLQQLRPIMEARSGVASSSTKPEGPPYLLPLLAKSRNPQQQQQQQQDSVVENSDATPAIDDDNKNNNSYRVCRNALQGILCFRRSEMKVVMTVLADGGEIPVHGLAGKMSNHGAHIRLSIHPDLHAFFDELKKIAEPAVAPSPQRASSTTTTAKMATAMKLPSHLSKRSLYYRFCHDRGWNVTADANGSMTQVPLNSISMLGGPKPIMSWTAFLSFWSQHYPKLEIKKKPPKSSTSPVTAPTTCGDCPEFANRMTYFKQRAQQIDDASSNNGEDDDAAGDDTVKSLMERAAEYARMYVSCSCRSGATSWTL